MIQSVHRLSLNYYKYNSLISNLYSNIGKSNTIYNSQKLQQYRYFSSSSNADSKPFETSKEKFLNENKEGLKYRDDYLENFKKETQKKAKTDTEYKNEYQVRSAIPVPEQDEVFHRPSSKEDLANIEFERSRPDSNIEEVILPFNDSSRFKPYSPLRSKITSTRVVNGVALGYSKRKRSHAVAYIKEGSGELLINGRTILDYFPSITYKDNVLQPLVMTETLVKWDINVKVSGGGLKGQSEASARAIAIGLCNYDLGYFPALKITGLLKSDSRKVERKKPGQLKARKKFPLVKR
ncbi:30S ribosomal protein S9 [Tieghemostelium lacteum]|uniref:30S ribosomal protein S9 n=1 Tax=Tieghemostelium lacteum TaxID=361077 RepID=A0A152A6K2_TIELA|nr:30S ribosomal protein S9 [Tieghemostelium lacteum]|eukprot:KYR01836.1 30S ribosomal protein S9 [Tieghemostelium lacteum]